MSSVIAAVEDEIVGRLRASFGATVREVDHKPARLDEVELARILTAAPGAYVSFLGWQRRAVPRRSVDGSYSVYLVAANASGDVARRRGDPATIGAYDMAEIAAVALEDWIAPSSAGAIEVRSCENLFSAAFEKMGRTVYALVLDLPIVLPTALPQGRIGEFITFDVSWDVPPLGNVSRPPPSANRDAGDTVTLPGPSAP